MSNNNISNCFLEDEFYNQVEKYIQYKKLNTGFKDLDEKLNGILPGLYILGADTGFGKTTFMLQAADHIANKGEKVLFYSLEMSKFEMHCKSLSRIAKQSLNEDVSVKNIMFNMDPETTDNCINEYKKFSDNIQIIEGNFDLTFSKLKESIISNIKDDKKPIVFIDYLQVLQPENFNMTDKANLDYNMKSIKKISRELFVPIFLISSLNRSAYNSDLTNTAFKESGGIEYTADVLLGLQGQIVDELKDFTTNSQKNLNQIKSIWDRYKTETKKTGIIKTKLKCLKNRFGKKDFYVSFNFYPKNNYFEEKNDIQYQDEILFDD
jgi:replicative DNA helicase